MSSLDIESIKRRWSAATKGPWERYTKEFRDNTGHSIRKPSTGFIVAFGGFGPVGGGSYCDAEAISHAPEDIAALISEVEKLREHLTAAREVHAVYVQQAQHAQPHQLAGAWDEGYRAGFDTAHRGITDLSAPVDPPHTNPYREEYPDEPLADVVAAYESGRKVVTKRPDNSVNGRIESP